MFGYIPSHVEFHNGVPTYILKYSPGMPILVNGKVQKMTSLEKAVTTKGNKYT